MGAVGRTHGEIAVERRREARARANLVEVTTELGMKAQTLSRRLGERRRKRRRAIIELEKAPWPNT